MNIWTQLAANSLIETERLYLRPFLPVCTGQLFYEKSFRGLGYLR